MKNLFMGFAALSLLLGALSCAKETSESANDGKGQLAFRTVLGKQALSRATEFTYSSWTSGAQLSVYAYKTGSTDAAYPVNPIVIDFDGTDWAPAAPVNSLGTVVRYYSLYNDGNALPAATATTDSYSFPYTVAALPSNQSDLIAAETATAGTLVALQFSHILSQVNFAIVQTPGMEITIDNIDLDDIFSTANYTMGATDGWATFSNPQQFAYDVSGTTWPTDGVASGRLELKDTNNAMMLIPQEFDTASTAELNVTFDLMQDGTTALATNETATILLKDCNIAQWLPGKRYVYELDFSSYVQTGVLRFNVSVADWEDADDAVNTIEIAAPNMISIEKAIATLGAANAADTDLGVFTVSVPEDVPATMPALTMISGFDAGDVIHIEFKDAASASRFSMNVDAANWTRADNGRVITLTCVAPMQIAPVVAATVVTPVDNTSMLAGIFDAVAAQSTANGTTPTLTLFPITVAEDFNALSFSGPLTGSFEAGDRIRIEFTGPDGFDTVANSSGQFDGWDAPMKAGNVLLFIKQ